ncbi:MAG: ABC transporter [Flavobacteriales bacterium]|nr:ABC transporter [Flavobacteriales bacterium]|tara:strand:- start:382 stop:1632 length:1251 start_codon:yes stop_codon:yes gene_type:complete
MILFNLIQESLRFSIQALLGNKLRTLLSLLGVTIGIFAIISVFAVVDSLERNIRDSVSSFGEDIVFIQKWPWSMGEDYPWWKYYQRPVPQLKELEALEDRLEFAEAICFVASSGGKTAKFESNDISDVSIAAVSHGYQNIFGFELSSGRYFSFLESSSGKPVAVIGFNIADALFDGENPLGKQIKIMGQKVLVVGVFEKTGDSIIGNSDDNNVVIPVRFAHNFIRINNQSTDPKLLVKAIDGVSNDLLKQDLIRVMRSVRRLPPNVDNNFALNEISIISKGIDLLFGVIDLAGIIIGGFSLLVGGFGIANIMFVSVKERTSIIGIQKAVGAKNYFILFQFLFESILLCFVGGGLGLLLVYMGTLIATYSYDFQIILSFKNIISGLLVSVLIGIIAGIIPAVSASKLDPVEAIRFGQ